MDLQTLLKTIPEDLQAMVHFMNCTLNDWKFCDWSIDDNKYFIQKVEHKYFVKIVG
jgi:hypothetical protein